MVSSHGFENTRDCCLTVRKRRFGNADATLRDIPYRMSQSSILDADTSDTVLPLREFASRFPYEAAAAAAATEQRQLRMDDAVASSEEIPLYLFSSEFAESNQDIYKDVLPLVRLVDKVRRRFRRRRPMRFVLHRRARMLTPGWWTLYVAAAVDGWGGAAQFFRLPSRQLTVYFCPNPTRCQVWPD